MFIQLFGNYLIEKNIIPGNLVESLQSEVTQTRVKMGTIAIADGMLTEAQAEEINHIQTQEDRRFGDIAVEKGYLTEAQVDEIIKKQGNDAMKFYQLLNEKAHLAISDVENCVKEFQKAQGFTDKELEAVKNDDFDTVVSLFAPVRNPSITAIASLVMKNLTRFVSNDFYFDRMKKVSSYQYSMIAGQKTNGDEKIYLGFSTEDELDGLMELAKGYASGVTLGGSDEVYDAICEFSNLSNGLFASENSKNDKYIDMDPPAVYLNQSIAGSAYVMPIFIAGKKLELILSDDAAFVPGNNPHTITIEKAKSNAADSSKTNVLIVDDSALIRKVLRNILESNGFNIVGEGVNGKEAVELYQEVKPDIVTLDVTMPEMDGVEALKKIMEADPKAKVIMITAAGQQSRLMEALKIGAKLFVTKPFNEEELVADLKQI